MFINHCHVLLEGTLPTPEAFMKKCGIDKVIAFSPAPHWMPRDTFYHRYQFAIAALSLKAEHESLKI